MKIPGELYHILLGAGVAAAVAFAEFAQQAVQVQYPDWTYSGAAVILLGAVISAAKAFGESSEQAGTRSASFPEEKRSWWGRFWLG